MTIAAWLSKAGTLLKEAGIETSRLDSLVLLSDELDADKAWVLAHPEYVLQIEQLEKLSTKIVQRCHHTPLAYIRGFAEFYGRNFIVNKQVLVPRPETESMIDALKRLTANARDFTVVDVGTGSGCLAITASLEIPSVKVIATDIDTSALNIAKMNAERLGASVIFAEGDLLEPLQAHIPKQPLYIIANLPYVPLDYPINKAAEHEPRIALFSNDEGLQHYMRFFSQIDIMHLSPHAIITESLLSQHDALKIIASKHGFKLSSTDGLAQTFVK